MNVMLRISFDIGGVLSKYPHVFKPMIACLTAGGAEVYIITDMHNRAHILEMLQCNKLLGAGMVDPARVLSADYTKHGERCKAKLIEEHQIDLHIDDFPGYCAAGGLQLMVWPNPDEPYYHDDWETDGSEGDFGRRRKESDKI